MNYVKSDSIVRPKAAKGNSKTRVIPGGKSRFLAVVFEREEAERYRRSTADFLKAESLLNRAVLLIDEANGLSAVTISPERNKILDAREVAFDALEAVRVELANKTRQLRMIEEREISEGGRR